MLILSASQTAFFSTNGFLELEGLISPEECAKLQLAIETTLAKRGSTDFAAGRDLWRDAPALKQLLLSRNFSALAFAATRKTSLRLVFDQWFPPRYSLAHPTKIQDLFSIQGTALFLFLHLSPENFVISAKTSPLGLLPFPKAQGNVLLIAPNLLLNWPEIAGPGLYLAAYALPKSLYICNERDPAGMTLKKLGYEYGDPLQASLHPLIHS